MGNARPRRGTGIRVLGGCLTTVAAVAALVGTWPDLAAATGEGWIDAGVGVLLVGVALLQGVLLLVGWSNGRWMTLSRARWRYWYTAAVLVVAAGTYVASWQMPAPDLMAGLGPFFVGNAFFMLFAPDTAPDWASKVTPVQRRRWRHAMVVLLLGAGLCAVMTVPALEGGFTGTAATLVTVGFLALFFEMFVAVQRVRLRRILGPARR